jgi:hypothetical protein
MNELILSSKKDHLLFLGFELFALGLIVFFLFNFQFQSVENIAHYNIISTFLLLFGVYIFSIGNQKRSFVFSDSAIKFINKKTKMNINYQDIYLVRFFRIGSSKQINMGIVDNNKNDVFQISTSFFDVKVLKLVAEKLIELSKQYEFLVEDETGWLELESMNILDQDFDEKNQNNENNENNE